jgi:hypothetical protein
MAMGSVAEKVARLQIRREGGWLYFLRGEEVGRTAARRAGSPSRPEERVAVARFTREDGWLYFLDDEGDVSRSRRPTASPGDDGGVHAHEPQLVGPVEKVARLGIRREPGFVYFFRGAELWRTRMKRAGEPAPPGPDAERVADGGFTCEEGWHYFLDQQGDVSRVRQAAPS